MQSETIFSERGLATIFRGEVVPQLRKDRTVEHYRVRGFRYESAEAEMAGCVTVKESRTADDGKGVYRARVIVRGIERYQTKSGFFPQRWTRNEVMDAIVEAYAHRELVNSSERLHKGKGRDVSMLIYLDEADCVIDAMPIRGKVSQSREALNRYERTGKRGKLLCPSCFQPKVLVCPSGHFQSSNQKGLLRRLRKRWRFVVHAIKHWR